MMLMKMQFPLSGEIMTTVRLATGGIASLVGLDLDASEDLKVCVTEGLLLLTHAGCTKSSLTFEKNDDVLVTLNGEEGNGASEGSVEEEISVALLKALVEDLSMERENGALRISFVFKGL